MIDPEPARPDVDAPWVQQPANDRPRVAWRDDIEEHIQPGLDPPDLDEWPDLEEVQAQIERLQEQEILEQEREQQRQRERARERERVRERERKDREQEERMAALLERYRSSGSTSGTQSSRSDTPPVGLDRLSIGPTPSPRVQNYLDNWKIASMQADLDSHVASIADLDREIDRVEDWSPSRERYRKLKKLHKERSDLESESWDLRA